MFSRLKRPVQLGTFLSFFREDENPYDRIDDKNEIYEPDPNETGFVRLKNLFRPHNNRPVHPALVTIIQTTGGSFIAGGIIGGITSSRKAFINFIENNEATRFISHLDAKRKLSDNMFTAFIKGFVSQGLRISFFCSTFIIIYTTISFYRNKDSPWHYSLGASCTGALYKFPLGPKGMISGAFFGGILGGIYGGWKFLALKLTGMTEENIRGFKFERSTEREQALVKAQQERQHEQIQKELNELMGTK